MSSLTFLGFSVQQLVEAHLGLVEPSAAFGPQAGCAVHADDEGKGALLWVEKPLLQSDLKWHSGQTARSLGTHRNALGSGSLGFHRFVSRSMWFVPVCIRHGLSLFN